MNRLHRMVFAILLFVLIATIVGLVATNRPIGAPRNGPSYQNEPFYRLVTVTRDQFDSAQKVAASAVTREEQWMAREVIRIADNEVDLAFATALQEAIEHPMPLSPEARTISDRLKSAQAQTDVDHADVERLTKLLAGAKEGEKNSLQQQLQLIQAQADLDQDEVDDAHQDLIRAGGDPQGIIERMKQRYETREKEGGGLQALVPSGPQASVEDIQSESVVALSRAWYSLREKLQRLQRAEQDARAQAGEFRNSHEKLDQETKRQAKEPSSLTARPNASQTANPIDSTPSKSDSTKISVLEKRAATRKNLQVFDKRLEDETKLADAYARWAAFVE